MDRRAPPYVRCMSAIQQTRAKAGSRVFERILCVTGESDRDAEAVSQAAILAGPGATVEFVAVAPERPPGAPRPEPHQLEALVRAGLLAPELGVDVEPHIVESHDEIAGMLARCPGHDLLVAPADETTLAAVTRSPIPILVARRPPEGATFPDSILIAVDAGLEAHAAARVGGRLASVHTALAALVAAPEHDAAHRETLEGNILEVIAATGSRPLVLDEAAAPAHAIVAAAARIGASMIVMGSRPGQHEASVSAQVAREAGCSVLVLRPRTPA